MDDLNGLSDFFEEPKEPSWDSEQLKQELQPIVEKLIELETKKSEIEDSLSAVNKEIQLCESEARRLWGPFLVGCEEAKIDLGAVVLESKKILNIKADAKELAIEWFKVNGYEGVMKYDIHHATMSKIGKEEYERGVMIPGLNYSHFDKIKAKAKRGKK